MPTAITVRIDLVEVQCGECGVWFGLEQRYHDERHRDHNTFYCPNGHGRAWLAESKEERLARELRAQRDYATSLNRQLTESQDSLRATRGVVTKLRKRAVAGACPFGCKRHFVNLERHVATRHSGEHLPCEAASA